LESRGQAASDLEEAGRCGVEPARRDPEVARYDTRWGDERLGQSLRRDQLADAMKRHDVHVAGRPRDCSDRGQATSTDVHDVNRESGKRKLLSECGKQLMESIGADVRHHGDAIHPSNG
jgi:hypothetical protein